MTTASSTFPWLRSCKQESEKPIGGTTTGEIPKWLKGCLIRIGPGLLEVGPDKYNHVFDGLALMHRFGFQDGQVTYQNRFLRSEAYQDNMRANRIIVSEFGTRGAPDPCKTIFQRFSSLFSQNMTDNDLVNIVLYGNETFACSETDNMWKIDTDTLESVQKVNLKDYLQTDGAIAHAHEDPDGSVLNIGTSLGIYSHYDIIKFPAKEEKSVVPVEAGTIICRIPASKMLNPSYIHSFATTSNYIILVEQPMYRSIAKITWAQFVAGAYSQALQWDPKSMSRFHVVRRSDGKLLDTPYLAAPFFVFHHINAFEEGENLVVDLCGYDKGDIVNTLYVKTLEEVFNKDVTVKSVPIESNARRYVLPLLAREKEKGVNLVTLLNCKATAMLREDGTVFCDFDLLTGKDSWNPELPRINYEHYNGKKYKYFYAMARKDEKNTAHLIKVDTETKTTVSWCEEGTVPSEPVFLPEPNVIDPEEDSGVVVASLLYQSDEYRVSMLILNAKTMTEIGRVTFQTKSAVPGDFHGTFVSSN